MVFYFKVLVLARSSSTRMGKLMGCSDRTFVRRFAPHSSFASLLTLAPPFGRRSMSSKNTLQEIYQKSKQPLPSYATVRAGSRAEDGWWSTVMLADGRVFEGEPMPSKKAAELSAAAKALAAPETENQDQEEQKPCPVSTVVLIDVENVQTIAHLIPPRENLTVLAFVGKSHALVDTIFPPHIKKIVSPTSYRDGNDCYMQMYTGYLLARTTYARYIFVTNDHFVYPLAELTACPETPWKKVTSEFAGNLERLTDLLR